MIRFLEHIEIDKQRWDACIAGSPEGNIYGYSWYLDTVSPGWCALVDADYLSVFPLPVRKKAGIRYIAHPFFAQKFGPYTTDGSAAVAVQSFVEAIPAFYRHVRLNLNMGVSGVRLIECTPNQNLVISLQKPYNEISDSYNENLKRNLKKALSIPFNKQSLTHADELVELFRQTQGRDILHLGDEEYFMLKQLITKAKANGCCKIDGVYYEGNLLAGVVWFFSHSRAVFIFSATSQFGRNNAAMPFLIDQFIRENAAKEIVLDFEGSGYPELARFYKSFGAEVENYYTITSKGTVSKLLEKVKRLKRVK